MGEDARPGEHRAEGDHFEQSEVDGAVDEQPSTGEQASEDGEGRQQQAPRHPVQEHRRREQERGEAQDHSRSDIVVDGLVDVEGNASHQRQIDADRGEEHLGGPARAPAADEGAQADEIAAYPVRVDRHEGAADHEGAVEEGAGGVVEGAQLAEVQVPPQRIGRRQHRQQDAADEHDEHPEGQLHRRQTRDECAW
ncbi:MULTISPECIES: hypothetical protein [Microbacterium]|uniref:hypothetical protein n=1 Tax=Microbacterium sp. dk485 TaxID=2560021 RepID=UPI001F0E3ED3|nr:MULTISPECIES: hypothetical protein [Microbacterium]